MSDLVFARVQERLTKQQVFLCNMPPNGATPLTAADKQLLLDWLACGAPNN